jgi:hypothetical protein
MHGAITCSEPSTRQGGSSHSRAQAPHTTTQHRRPNKQNVELNKQIQSTTNIQELCDLIRSSSAEFNHVNVATALRKVLQAPRRGVSPEVVVKALKTLEESALQQMQDFGPQQTANTLHIMAKYRHKPSQALLMALEGRAEAISGEFNSQEVANTLWAFATMGRKPGERMMGQLEGRAEAISGEFNSQEVANTLWSVYFFAYIFQLCTAIVSPS